MGYDDDGSLMVSWDCGKRLFLILGVDRLHIVETDEEIDRSFENLKLVQSLDQG